jgi:hypothetical protein
LSATNLQGYITLWNTIDDESRFSSFIAPGDLVHLLVSSSAAVAAMRPRSETGGREVE